MNKITKKLFLYFTLVSSFLAIIVFIGFYGTFHYYSLQHHEKELQTRAETIQVRLESFMNNCTGTQELGTYVKVLDDISLADAYFISRDGKSFTCSCSCNSSITIEKEPPKEIYDYGLSIIESGNYTQTKLTDADNNILLYVGIPVKENGTATAAVIIVDTFDIDKKSFFLSVSILFICLILALFISAFFSSFLAKRFMYPIHKIASATKELANGNYQAKTEIHDKNEIGVLAREIDILAEKLESARKESENMEQMQKDYLSNISHELRTPVTIIRSSLEAICDGVIDTDKVQDYQKQLLQESISLQRLINDILELSRLQNNDFPIDKNEIDLLSALNDAIRATRLIATDKKIRIHYEKPETEWPFLGDYGRLRQMFIVALDNSVKYSAMEKDIWVTTHIKKNCYCVSIKDEGYGIPAEELPFIFNKFHRSSNTNCPGTGLGLAIMKSIAQRHEITLQINSLQDVGTTVIFLAPRPQ